MAVHHVGRPLKRLEDPRLVTGRDPYVNDVRLANALTMAVVRSPYPHALIKSIDVGPAPGPSRAWWVSGPAGISIPRSA